MPSFGLAPFVAYSSEDLERCMKQQLTSEDATNLLARVRGILQRLSRDAGRDAFCTPGELSSVGSLLAPMSSQVSFADTSRVAQQAKELTLSLVSDEASQRPDVFVLQGRQRLVSCEDADACEPHDRRELIPIRGTDTLMDAKELQEGEETERILVSWPKTWFPGSKTAPQISFEDSPSGLVLKLKSASNLTSEIVSRTVDVDVRRRLFQSCIFVDPQPATLPIPPSSDVVPPELLKYLGYICQSQLRLQTLLSAATPNGALRPVAFEFARIQIHSQQCHGRKARMTVRATIHNSSATCLCAAHNLRPAGSRFPALQFNGRTQVVVLFDMCAAQMPCGIHNGLHKSHRDPCTHEFASGMCCANVEVKVQCLHSIVEKERDSIKEALGAHFVYSEDRKRERDMLTTVLGAIAKYQKTCKPLYEQGNQEAAIRLHIARLDAHVDRSLDALEAQSVASGAPRSEAELKRVDMEAVDMLRDGGVLQHGKKSLKRAGEDLDKDEKKTARLHNWMFPKQGTSGRMRSDTESTLSGETVGAGRSPSGRPATPSVAESIPMSAPRVATDSTPFRFNEGVRIGNLTFVDMNEYLDVLGFQTLQSHLYEASQDQTLSQGQREKLRLYQQYADVLDRAYSKKTMRHPTLGLPVRMLPVQYTPRKDGGRLYGRSPYESMHDWIKGERRQICLQGMPKPLRPYCSGRLCRDLDMVNAHPTLLLQMPEKLTWDAGYVVPPLVELANWVHHREAFIDDIMNFHGLTDAQHHPGFCKSKAKLLMLRLVFGGDFRPWLKEIGMSTIGDKCICPRVQTLAAELKQLRVAVFDSHEWRGWVTKDMDRERSSRLGGRSHHSKRYQGAVRHKATPAQLEAILDEDLKRSSFAKVAQKTEAQLLTAALEYLHNEDWRPAALCFDGVMICHCPEWELDLDAMSDHMHNRTGYKVRMEEKPLLSSSFPEALELRA